MTEGMSLSQLNHPTINMNNAEVANNPNDKASGEEYFDRRGQRQEKEEFQQSPFVDRTAQLRATLNSLAALNAANVVKAKDKYRTKPILKDNKDQEQDEENNNQQESSKKETTQQEENKEEREE